MIVYAIGLDITTPPWWREKVMYIIIRIQIKDDYIDTAKELCVKEAEEAIERRGDNGHGKSSKDSDRNNFLAKLTASTRVCNVGIP